MKMSKPAKPGKPQNILIDTGFWFALFDPKDGYYRYAQNLWEEIKGATLILPWPTLYETVNTKFSKNTNGIIRFEKLLKKPDIQLLDDVKYKERALVFTLEKSTSSIRPISLVDAVIREILSDVNVDIRYLLSFNKKDFIDICNKRKIRMVGNE
jgi:predicted nucleic acid-binding protein